MLPLQAPEIYPKTQQAKSNRVPKFKQSPIVTKCQQPKLSRPSFLLLLLLPLLLLLSLLPLLPAIAPAVAPPTRTKTSILCSKCPKTGVPEAKSAQKPRFCAQKARKQGFQTAKAHKNPNFVLEMPENGGLEGQKSTKTSILCSKCPKTRVPDPKSAQKPRFCARGDWDWHREER